MVRTTTTHIFIYCSGLLWNRGHNMQMKLITDNKNTATSADPTIYEVKLIKNNNLSMASIDGKNPFTFTVSPIPIANKIIKIQFNLPYVSTLDYFISSIDGKIVDDGEIQGLNIGNSTMNFSLENANTEMVILTFIFDHKFYVSQKVYVK